MRTTSNTVSLDGTVELSKSNRIDEIFPGHSLELEDRTPRIL
jgi:hypothetical protein